MKNIISFLLASLLTSSFIFTLTNSAYADEGQASFVSGGVGQEEADEMRAKAGDFNLRLYMSEGKHGHGITGAQVTITDKKGNVVLNETNSGPMLFAHVENGRYNVNATYKDKMLSRKVVVINHRGVNAYLIWKATDSNEDNYVEDRLSQ